MVFVVDDDMSVREALTSLLRSANLRVQTFGSAREFLQRPGPHADGCLVLDVRLPGLNGLELQKELARRGEHIPIIFITAHGDIPMSVRAMKAGAIEFLQKPFSDGDLLSAIHQGLELARVARQHVADNAAVRQLYNTLSMREREVLERIVAGLLNKQTAAELGISEITVKVHRRHIMQKLGAKSFADLVRIAERLRQDLLADDAQ